MSYNEFESSVESINGKIDNHCFWDEIPYYCVESVSHRFVMDNDHEVEGLRDNIQERLETLRMIKGAMNDSANPVYPTPKTVGKSVAPVQAAPDESPVPRRSTRAKRPVDYSEALHPEDNRRKSARQTEELDEMLASQFSMPGIGDSGNVESMDLYETVESVDMEEDVQSEDLDDDLLCPSEDFSETDGEFLEDDVATPKEKRQGKVRPAPYQDENGYWIVGRDERPGHEVDVPGWSSSLLAVLAIWQKATKVRHFETRKKLLQWAYFALCNIGSMSHSSGQWSNRDERFEEWDSWDEEKQRGMLEALRTGTLTPEMDAALAAIPNLFRSTSSGIERYGLLREPELIDWPSTYRELRRMGMEEFCMEEAEFDYHFGLPDPENEGEMVYYPYYILSRQQAIATGWSWVAYDRLDTWKFGHVPWKNHLFRESIGKDPRHGIAMVSGVVHTPDEDFDPVNDIDLDRCTMAWELRVANLTKRQVHSEL
ncbi:unnamed protein product [Clonostachys rosea]|uniref:Uncharacterized protein n=1 Tax=Bionectria ochroleuca TaxID=29856 RepID=A0ABY6UXL9_BIOOC|nr:unnamed protein product [Clonostachys rosea]